MKDEVIAALWKIEEDIAREHGFNVKRLGAMLRERDHSYADRVVDWSHSKEAREPGRSLRDAWAKISGRK